MFQISFYVPETKLELVKNTMFKGSAGRFSMIMKIALGKRLAWVNLDPLKTLVP